MRALGFLTAKAAATAALAFGLWPTMGAACGVDTDCQLGERVYRIAMPESGAATGAVIFNHGYRGSQKGAMRNKALIEYAHGQGMALVSTKSADEDWQIPGVPSDPSVDGAEELAYFDALNAALEAEHGIDPNRLVVSGFSAGGMMVWNLACHRGASYAGFVPIAGTFWEPVPAECPSGAVNLVHVHGTSDKIVPLTGRKIAQTKQGSIFDALQMISTVGAYGDRVPVPPQGDLTCAARFADGGELLGFCTHPGGHSFKIEYLAKAMELLQGSGALPAE